MKRNIKVKVAAAVVMAAVCGIGAQCSDRDSQQTTREKANRNEKDSVIIFADYERMPVFIDGGDAGLMRWIAEHKEYPASALERKVEGKVVVQFVIKKDGSVGEVKVARGKDPDLNAEAVRLVKMLPNFRPAFVMNDTVECWYTLPINFKLPVEKKDEK